MRSEPVALWMALAFGAALVLACATVGLEGVNQHGINAGLALTARFSFLLFLPAYVGGSLACLFGPIFLPIKRRARVFGLSFASAHLVHLGLVGLLCLIGATPALRTFLFFGFAVFWLYLIAFFSFGKWQSLNPRLKALLFTVGLNYILYAFAVDFFNTPLSGGLKHIIAYLPFAAISIAAPLLRLAAFCKRLLQDTEDKAFLKKPS